MARRRGKTGTGSLRRMQRAFPRFSQPVETEGMRSASSGLSGRIAIRGLGLAAIAIAAGWAIGGFCQGVFAESATLAGATTQPARITQEQFLAVVKPNCARCHDACASVAELQRKKWLVPGQPDSSRVYKIVNNAKPGNKKHTLSDADKRIVRDFIEQMKG